MSAVERIEDLGLGVWDARMRCGAPSPTSKAREADKKKVRATPRRTDAADSLTDHATDPAVDSISATAASNSSRRAGKANASPALSSSSLAAATSAAAAAVGGKDAGRATDEASVFMDEGAEVDEAWPEARLMGSALGQGIGGASLGGASLGAGLGMMELPLGLSTGLSTSLPLGSFPAARLPPSMGQLQAERLQQLQHLQSQVGHPLRVLFLVLLFVCPLS